MPEHLPPCPEGHRKGDYWERAGEKAVKEDQGPDSPLKFPEKKELATLPQRGCDGWGVFSFVANVQHPDTTYCRHNQELYTCYPAELQ